MARVRCSTRGDAAIDDDGSRAEKALKIWPLLTSELCQQRSLGHPRGGADRSREKVRGTFVTSRLRDESVLVVGPEPPPMMGPAVCVQMISACFERLGVRVVRVNTQDDRTTAAKSVFNLNIFDARNIVLALKHGAETAWKAMRYPVSFVYVPISQGRWGYARDALLMVIARLAGRPIVIHLHGASLRTFFDHSTQFERFVIRRTLGWSAFAIALTPRLAGVFDGLVPSQRVRVLENGVVDPWPAGLDCVFAARRERAALTPKQLKVLFVANDWGLKGGRTLVRALAEPGLGRAQVRLVGRPTSRIAQEIGELAAELGVAKRVESVGGVEGAALWAQHEWADVFAYPTNDDAQPLVVLEAMAAGLPVVASRIGGIPQTLDTAGILIEPRDHEALAASLHSLIEDPELRLRLGTAARTRFVSHYNVEAFQQRFDRLFGEILRALST